MQLRQHRPKHLLSHGVNVAKTSKWKGDLYRLLTSWPLYALQLQLSWHCKTAVVLRNVWASPILLASKIDPSVINWHINGYPATPSPPSTWSATFLLVDLSNLPLVASTFALLSPHLKASPTLHHGPESKSVFASVFSAFSRPQFFIHPMKLRFSGRTVCLSSLTTPFLNRLPQQILCQQRSEVDNYSTWIFCIFLCLFQNISNFNRLLISLHFLLHLASLNFMGISMNFLHLQSTFSHFRLKFFCCKGGCLRFSKFSKLRLLKTKRLSSGSAKIPPTNKTQNTWRMFFSANSKIKNTFHDSLTLT